MPLPADLAAQTREALARLRGVFEADHGRTQALLALLDRLVAEQPGAEEPGAGQPGAEIQALRAENAALRQQIAGLNQHAEYEAWFNATFKTTLRTPNTWPFTTFAHGTPWCDKVVYGMQDGEFLFAEHLIEQLDAEGVQGDIVEFGAYGGTWLEILARIIEKRENGRGLWGFDSFEGLPAPDPDRDGGIWTEGQYAMGLEEVSASLRLAERPFLRLVKGWFCDSLKVEPATSIQRIAYARIDGDLYASAVDCLAFLTDRLADGAILVFDDWQFTTQIGEVLAFREWIADHPIFEFEFLGMNMWAHLYLRVRRRG
jgi:hypothetical protein